MCCGCIARAMRRLCPCPYGAAELIGTERGTPYENQFDTRRKLLTETINTAFFGGWVYPSEKIRDHYKDNRKDFLAILAKKSASVTESQKERIRDLIKELTTDIINIEADEKLDDQDPLRQEAQNEQNFIKDIEPFVASRCASTTKMLIVTGLAFGCAYVVNRYTGLFTSGYSAITDGATIRAIPSKCASFLGHAVTAMTEKAQALVNYSGDLMTAATEGAQDLAEYTGIGAVAESVSLAACAALLMYGIGQLVQ